VISEADALRFQLRSQAAHWRTATVGLAALDNFAAPEAWRALESYLGLAIRRHLQEAVTAVQLELDAIEADLRAARMEQELERTQRRMNAFRHRYLQVETVLEFYGHAVRSRTTPRLAELLRACDLLAAQSMDAALHPLGVQAPPVLVYVDRGLGASILRAGLRLWDGGSLSPAAAVKITRFNLYRPTSMLHEAGHQVAHLTGWNAELAAMLRNAIPDEMVARAWEGWATELGPDLIAFAHSGYGSVAALADVLMGDSSQVFNYPLGDPHPIAYLRVLVAVQMCVRFYGVGPWDVLGRAWARTHPLSAAPAEVRALVARSVEQLPRIVEIGLRTPMRSFGGRALVELVDPARVSPAALAQLTRDGGQALTTSSHWLRSEAMRLLARSALEIATEPDRATEIARDYEVWMRRLGALANDQSRAVA
jgi:hypothetical protein